MGETDGATIFKNRAGYKGDDSPESAVEILREEKQTQLRETGEGNSLSSRKQELSCRLRLKSEHQAKAKGSKPFR